MSIQAIIEKVQKLQRLSTSSNANEAAAATAAANRLIDQYRLSEVDLEVNTSDEHLEFPEEDSDYIYESGKVTGWKMLLISILAKHYGCAYWNDTDYTGGRKISRYKLVGKKTDISIIRYMFAWLSSECQRLSNFEVKGQGRIISASYCHGFVNGIATQLATSRVEVQKQASSASIIKIDARENEARIAMYKLHSNLRTVRTNSQSKIDSNAFSMGKAKGVGMHLGSSFGASGRVNLLNK